VNHVTLLNELVGRAGPARRRGTVSTSNLEASQQLDVEAPRQRASVKLATSSIARHLVKHIIKEKTT
jgi:hypothetical protein